MSLTILFSSVGRRAELLNCFRTDARELGVGLRVLACDMEADYSSACRMADRSFNVPPCTAPEFLPAMLRICEKERVNLLVPTIDTELPVFSENQLRFASIGTYVAISDDATVRAARNKQVTVDLFARHGIPTPRTGSVEEVMANPNLWRWPLILKPIGGSGSVGIELVKNKAEFESARRNRTDFVAQEFCSGREYTVNLFFTRDGVLRTVIPHWRMETRSGEVSKGITSREPTLLAIGKRIARALPGARGPLCFQAILSEDGSAYVIELNARFGGGYPLTHAAGGQFSKWLLEEAMNIPSSATNQWRDGMMMLRYDAAMFVAL